MMVERTDADLRVPADLIKRRRQRSVGRETAAGRLYQSASRIGSCSGHEDYSNSTEECSVNQNIAQSPVSVWRTTHSQRRGLLSLLLTDLPDVDTRAVREGEIVCNFLIGFNFGDGHLHNAEMVQDVQHQAAFEPGKCVVARVEAEAAGSGVQHYQLIDPTLGVVERGNWRVADAVAEQSWLPNGPIPLDVSWALSGSQPGHGALA
jgi:hypothetical protein